jgi:hypothetical protein
MRDCCFMCLGLIPLLRKPPVDCIYSMSTLTWCPLTCYGPNSVKNFGCTKKKPKKFVRSVRLLCPPLNRITVTRSLRRCPPGRRTLSIGPCCAQQLANQSLCKIFCFHMMFRDHVGSEQCQKNQILMSGETHFLCQSVIVMLCSV